MKIHEHQAKELLTKFSVPAPRGRVAFSVDEAVAGAKKLQEDFGIGLWVVKAQIHAGGRGKAGGVKIAKSIEEVKSYAEEILGKTLVTHQTGQEGQLVRRLWIEEGNPPETEMYLSLVTDRETKSISLLASAEGGVDIEDLAENEPEKLLKMSIDFSTGWQPHYSRRLASFLKIPMKDEAGLSKQLHKFMTSLYSFFVQNDAEMLEINPLCICGKGAEAKIIALDAKVNFDDNASYRHPTWAELRDEHEEDPAEREASKHELNFINLDGTIGCMVNGAGLAMATMDIIKHYGAEPANFLDVGGSATTERVREAFKIILSDKKVKAVFVNIFGGIMKCDTIAEGVLAAAKEINLNIPLIVRLEGTNVEKGRALLNESSLKIITATSMADGAKKAVEAIA